MISKKSIITIAMGSMFAITLGTAPISMASNQSSPLQFENQGFMVAEVHQHGQEKISGQGKGKEEDHKHGDKKSSGMMKGGHSYAHMIIFHADELKLSDEQLGKITRLHLKHKQEHGQLKQKLHKSMKTFKKESMQPSTTDAQLRNLGKEFTNVVNEMVEYHIKERQLVHAVLSDEQKNQLKSMKMEHDAHGDHHGGRGCH